MLHGQGELCRAVRLVVCCCTCEGWEWRSEGSVTVSVKGSEAGCVCEEGEL